MNSQTSNDLSETTQKIIITPQEKNWDEITQKIFIEKSEPLVETEIETL